ncbi:RDD family protein [Prolixibacter denitrificans]|jgi:hypothetical protein|uniref:RDD domain-containing protein n=1 Tax=Prolixibacter denitrificans TaxID=1541063 RepID=A0A2P8C5G7_9BACT|nr:RDD family protein [Prolixibacter denitrificans]PSK80198.1 hypothetical protein CLV93_12113 [Prolixibacter denitrificans]GET22373.1 hypothetical protein JCM18694_26190 [Prolixibacter denitrificans]
MTGKKLRLVNFLLDTIIYLILILAFILLFKESIPREDVKWISVLAYFFYYFLFELLAGRTPAKFITNSKVSSLAETKNTFFYLLQILGRTIMRFIPIDILSYLFSFRGLHDYISKTTITKL